MKQLFLLLTIVALLFTGCQNDSDSVNGTSSGNVTLKYEIESTSAFSPVFLNGVQLQPPLNVTYINESGQAQSEMINTNASTWSKTIQLTATQRPININFNTTAFTATATGTGILRVYVNGVLKASQNVQIAPNGYQGGGFSGATGRIFGFINYPI
jgi:hypothetical protein